MKSKLVMLITLIMLIVLPLTLNCGQKQAEEQAPATDGKEQAATTTNETQTQESPMLAEADKPAAVPETPATFSGVEKQLMDTLLVLWNEKSNMTSIDQAAKMLGISASDSVRIDMLKTLEKNESLSEKLTRYHPYTFVLTNEEKRIAELILNSEKQKSGFPSIKEVSAATGIAEPELRKRLKFLANIGLLYDLGGPDEYNALGYSFGTRLTDFTYDMGLRYHTFSVEGGLPFNVGCAKEAMYLAATEYLNDKVSYDTDDPVSLKPVQVQFFRGQVLSLTPADARYVEGGPCGSNNLFTSESDANMWIGAQPKLIQPQAPPILDIRQHFEQVVAELKKSGQK